MAKSSAPPAFQFYARDYYLDVQGRSLSAAGAHAKLRAWAWMNGPVPNDATARANAMGAQRKAADAAWAEIKHLWTESELGFVEDAIEGQRGSLTALTALNRQKGKASAAARRDRYGTAQPRFEPNTEPRRNRGSDRHAEPNTEPSIDPRLEPRPNSSIFDLQDQDQDQTKKEQRAERALHPVQAVENSDFRPLEIHDPTPQVLERIAHKVLDDVDAGALDPLDICEELKCRVAKARLRYDATLTGNALRTAQIRRGLMMPREAAAR